MELLQTLEFIYEKCSTRIQAAITDSGLSLSKIYKSDPKILSAIQTNNRTKRNPYLVPDRVFDDPANDDGLLKKLHFKTRQDVLWGTTQEIKSYAEELFFIILSDLQEHQSELDFSIEDILCDYIPYAKCSSYWKLLFNENNTFAAILYGVFEDSVIENIEPSWNGAIRFLYKKCEIDYLSELTTFTQQTTSFHGIDKVLYDNFICAKLAPILKKHIPDENSLGIRVKDLIIADLSHVAKLMTGTEKEGLEDYHRTLNSASSKYIVALEKLQAKLYGKYGI